MLLNFRSCVGGGIHISEKVSYDTERVRIRLAWLNSDSTVLGVSIDDYFTKKLIIGRVARLARPVDVLAYLGVGWACEE